MKGIRCFDMIKKKYVYAYHISDDGAAHNKSNTLCIGCIGYDLIPANTKMKLNELLEAKKNKR